MRSAWRATAGHRKRHRIALGILLLLVALSLSATGYELSLPTVANAPALVTAIVRAHHGTLGQLPIPTKLGDAIVAVEDEHFYSNAFLNVFDGAARAGLASLRAESDPGGSTIDQQLAKQLCASGGGVGGTLEEIGLGVKLSLLYSKPAVLEMYLNAIYFGNGYWGYVTAARGYFDRSPDQLTWAQAAMLAGLPQAPSAYDPIQHYTLAKQRQQHVLAQLVVNGYLTSRQAATAYREPLGLRRA